MIEILDNVDDKTTEAYKLFHQIKNAHLATAGQVPMMDSDSEIEWVDFDVGATGSFTNVTRVFFDSPHVKYSAQTITVVDGRITAIGAVSDYLVTTAALCPGYGSDSTASTASSASSASASSASASSESASTSGG